MLRQSLLVCLALLAVVLAAPTSAGKYQHVVTGSKTIDQEKTHQQTRLVQHRVQHQVQRTPPHGESAPYNVPFVVKSPKNTADHLDTYTATPSTTTSWIKKWKSPLSWKKANDRLHATPACFCAGGATCCHSAQGINCNAGYCGI